MSSVTTDPVPNLSFQGVVTSKSGKSDQSRGNDSFAALVDNSAPADNNNTRADNNARAQDQATSQRRSDDDANAADARRSRDTAAADRAARSEIEAAARQVATVTAFVPLALADVAAALTMNLRMIRRIAEIYGGRAGAIGGWRLLRTVLTHLVATGAVAVGDDLIQSVAGGGLLSKLSRRFGEGVVNGALTARVGVAAMELARPMPFSALPRPGTSATTSRALAGLFGRAEKP